METSEVKVSKGRGYIIHLSCLGKLTMLLKEQIIVLLPIHGMISTVNADKIKHQANHLLLYNLKKCFPEFVNLHFG